MMRSLYAGVAGLKTHQTKMDIIGNNIANVNTTAYKAQTITFNELMYQTTKRASGASADTGVGGTNAGQIGLGVKVGSINTNISAQGAMQTTNLPFDIAITGDSFFIVSNGFENFFTRAGSFYVDGAGNLAMTSTGYNVMGWLVDPENPNNIRKDTVQALRVMTEANMTYEAEATTKGTISGIIDRNDSDLNSSAGKIMNLEFFDDQGFKYTARLSTHVINADNGEYYTKLVDILDSNGVSIGPAKMAQVNFGGTQIVESNLSYLTKTGVSNVQTITLSAGATPAAVGAPQIVSTTSVPQKYVFPVPTPTDTNPGAILTREQIGQIYGPAALESLGGTGTTPPFEYTIDRNGRMSLTVAGKTTNYLVGTGTTNSSSNITSFRLSEPAGTDINFTTVPASYTFNGTAITPAGTPAPPALTLAQVEALYGISMEGIREFSIGSDGTLTVTRQQVENSAIMNYNVGNGRFMSIGGNTEGLISLNFTQGGDPDMSNFKNIELNFLNTLTNNNNGKSTISASAGGTGSEKGVGTGRRSGDMIEIVVQDDGKIYANYDNGMSRLLAQIAVATFANPSGLEKKGDNLYAATMNSGIFDGIGDDIKNGGGYMTSGVLEMSNVDLSSEFTEMITTQRGFQANSRIITVSDSLLEELTNLKR